MEDGANACLVPRLLDRYELGELGGAGGNEHDLDVGVAAAPRGPQRREAGRHLRRRDQRGRVRVGAVAQQAADGGGLAFLRGKVESGLAGTFLALEHGSSRAGMRLIVAPQPLWTIGAVRAVLWSAESIPVARRQTRRERPGCQTLAPPEGYYYYYYYYYCYYYYYYYY